MCSAILVALAAAGCGGQAAAGEHDPHPIAAAASADSAPVVRPGQLRGLLFYVPYDAKGCVLHRYDLWEGSDSVVAPLQTSCPYLPNFTVSPDGGTVAWLGDRSPGLNLFEIGAGHLAVGPGNERTTDYPDTATIGPVFSPDSQQVAYCRKLVAAGQAEWVVADARTGRVEQTMPACTEAFTRDGIAQLTGGKLTINRRSVALRPGLQASVEHAYQITAPADGRRIAIVAKTRDARDRVTGVVSIYTLGGSLVARHAVRGRLDWPDGSLIINFAIMRLSPRTDSAMFWWGDISRLAAFGAPGPFRLGLGERSETANLVSYSPDGRYAAMGRRAQPSLGGLGAPVKAPPPQDAVIMDAGSLAPLLRVPVHTVMLAWVR
jgi:hypothetical protein